MPRISLRTYEKEIEEMIEQNQLSEAVAHCKQILQFFPKNISTYRILGKAFLEARQYKETADIFTRVLTVFPDDFIAHAGMSIVREAEGNLDAAIWHMQLAFDSQPSNIAIQAELKRLFDLRDGTHPDKIRLTRGALVRMYARGELFQQAIDEIKSALTEEPRRMDLQIFLAKMYFLAGDQEEALSISERLINDLPYSFELNKILVAILHASETPKKAETFSKRLVELNPYQAYVNENYPSEDQVPDEKVVIEKLMDVSAMTAPIETNWAPDISAPWSESAAPISEPENGEQNQKPFDDEEFAEMPHAEAVLPKSEEIPQEEVSNMSESVHPTGDDAVDQPDDENIPDWMRNSGWVPSTGNSETPPEGDPAMEKTFQSQEEEEAISADIPDWLKTLSQNDLPEEVPASEPANEKTEEAAPAFTDASAWMNEIITENTPSKELNDSELPDWLKNFDAEEKVEPVQNDDLPGWLNALKNEEAPMAKPSATFAPSAEEDKTPQVGETSPEMPAETELPSSTQVESTPAEEATTDFSALFSEEKSTWQPETEVLGQTNVSAEPEEADPTATISQETEDDLLGWLRDLKPAETEESVESPEVPEESLNNEDQGYDFAVQLERLQQLNGSDDALPKETEELEPVSATEPEETQNEAVPAVSEVSEQAVTEESPLSSIPQDESEPVEADEPAAEAPIDLTVAEDTDEQKEAESVPAPSEEEPVPAPSEKGIDVSLQELKELAEANPEDYLGWQKLGDAYAKSGDLELALAAYTKAESILIHTK